MADETLRDFLERRTRELNNQIVVLRAELSAKQAEYAEVERAKKAPDEAPAGPVPEFVPSKVYLSARGTAMAGSSARLMTSPPNSESKAPQSVGPGAQFERYAAMTIKELVLEALKVLGKAPQAGLREFMDDGFHRRVEPDSLRPQLARLRADELISLHDGVWSLTAKGKRLLGYDHPSSRKTMSELKDEPIQAKKDDDN